LDMTRGLNESSLNAQILRLEGSWQSSTFFFVSHF
jgi:hypothetical protein